MSLFRTVIRSNTLQAIKTNQALPFLLRQPPKQFSTEPENPPQKTDLADPENQKKRYPDSAIDPILQSSSNEAIYGKLTGIGKHTLKTDIVDMLEGCALSPMDIRVDYNRHFNPQGMVLQFQSRTAFDTAIRLMRGKGQMFRLEKVDRSMWEITTYEGKTVLLQGIPRQAQPDDVEHFLCGCDFNPSNMRLFMRQAYPDPIRMGLIQFRTQIEAMRAVMMKNRSFCLNSQILMRVLH